ncbi:hypothetical protein Kpho02_73830 [Kitasatospora phosalacinea]|uniref:Uncharacterized protein n=1 Tax=Kitasatospora phosalacinea TaxID=2065 RepID=A0A9W6QGB0_9ACTN|nr:hypothetical protein [Kitasatospora phosalacinea]GLW75086.1 hypothetical protein Kpho02_73830 [Kitasatospora phosalacinea]
MRAPTELGLVDWSALEHAYGPAEDLPELLAGLYGQDAAAVEEAQYELVSAVCHQGSVYSASAATVPYLAHAALHAPLAAGRNDALALLFLMAEHESEELAAPRWAGSATAAVCRELERVLPGLLPCLADPEEETRQLALRVVAAVADLLPQAQREELADLVGGLHEADASPSVRADALVALDRLGRELAFLDSPLSEVRQVSAVLVAERHGPPYPAEAVAVFAADGASGGPGIPWPVTGSPNTHLHRLLQRDPDAALAVAGRWIADGDGAGTDRHQGSWLATAVARVWRDREAAVLDLVAAALPHHHEDPRHLLRTAAHWIEHLRTPPAALLDALRAHLDRDPAALLGLVRARVPGVLDLLPGRPGAALLAEAARLLPAREHPRLRTLAARRLAAGADEYESRTLVETLDLLGGGTPELLACLREGRAAAPAARALGRTAVTAAPAELTVLLRESTRAEDGELRAAAAVALHRLTGDLTEVLRVFPELLADGEPLWQLAELAPLGAAAAPLLPLVVPLLGSRRAHVRLAAARAHHRITGDPGLPAADLIARLAPERDVLGALPLLAALPRLPEEARPFLRGLAFSPRRLLADDPLGPTGGGLPDYRARSLALALLRT